MLSGSVSVEAQSGVPEKMQLDGDAATTAMPDVRFEYAGNAVSDRFDPLTLPDERARRVPLAGQGESVSARQSAEDLSHRIRAFLDDAYPHDQEKVQLIVGNFRTGPVHQDDPPILYTLSGLTEELAKEVSLRPDGLPASLAAVRVLQGELPPNERPLPLEEELRLLINALQASFASAETHAQIGVPGARSQAQRQELEESIRLYRARAEARISQLVAYREALLAQIMSELGFHFHAFGTPEVYIQNQLRQDDTPLGFLTGDVWKDFLHLLTLIELDEVNPQRAQEIMRRVVGYQTAMEEVLLPQLTLIELFEYVDGTTNLEIKEEKELGALYSSGMLTIRDATRLIRSGRRRMVLERSKGSMDLEVIEFRV